MMKKPKKLKMLTISCTQYTTALEVVIPSAEK
jgi:hypothetical protein